MLGVDTDVSEADLLAMWHGDFFFNIAATTETRTALAALGEPRGPLVPVGEHPEVTAKSWAIVRADELAPAWQIITVDGRHPLAKDGKSPLTVTHCGPSNIDPDAMTIVAMTGVTAMARFTALLMDKQGVTYPARDVEGWLGEADFVHVSNEVSFTQTPQPTGDVQFDSVSVGATIRTMISRGSTDRPLVGCHWPLAAILSGIPARAAAIRPRTCARWGLHSMTRSSQGETRRNDD
jgi:poly-gamma-glutamate synthesis protein (capsule biosynthesis protein)